MNRSVGLKRFRQHQDVERHVTEAAQDSLTLQRARFAEALLGEPAKTEWVVAGFGVASAAGRRLCQYTEQQLGRFAASYFHRLLIDLNIATDLPRMEDILSFACTVIDIVRNLKNRQKSIDDITRDVYERYEVGAETRSALQTDLLRQAIFALFGIFTMLYIPSTSPTTSQFEMILSGQSSRHARRQDLDQAGRPLFAFLAAFGIRIPGNFVSGIMTAQDFKFELSLLNYSSLSLDIKGRNIAIKWIDTLSSHLDFDADLKTLQVFRLPSLCAANYLGGSSKALYNW